MMGSTMHKKGKAIILEERSKAPVVRGEAGESSKRNSTALLFPELHSDLHLPEQFQICRGVWICLLALAAMGT